MGDSGRLPEGFASFAEGTLEFIRRTMEDVEETETIRTDFLYFSRVLMAAVSQVDEINVHINKENRGREKDDKLEYLPMTGASIRNLYVLGFLRAFGFLREMDKSRIGKSAVGTAEEQAAYEQAAKAMAKAAGVSRAYVTVSSFDPKTVCAGYKGYTLIYRTMDIKEVDNAVRRKVPEIEHLEKEDKEQLLETIARLVEPKYRVLQE